MRNKKTGLLTMQGYRAINDIVNRIDPVEFAGALNAWLVENSDELKSETRHFITSLEHGERSAARLAHAIRGHWSVENKNHWKRDTSLRKEDASKPAQERQRSPGARPVEGGAVLRFHDTEGFESLNAGFHHHSAKPRAALQPSQNSPAANQLTRQPPCHFEVSVKRKLDRRGKSHSLQFMILVNRFLKLPKIFVLIFGFVLSTLHGGELRTWTEVSSGKTIRAEILEKSSDNKRVRLKLKNGKSVWLETSRLSEADRNYVQSWALTRLRMKAQTLAAGSVRFKGESGNVVVFQSESGDEVWPAVTDGVKSEFKTTKRNIGVDIWNNGTNRDFILEVYWLGFPENKKQSRRICATTVKAIQIPPGNRYSAQIGAIYKFREETEFDLHGTKSHTASGYTYAGWLVRISSQSGQPIAKAASQQVLVKYLEPLPVRHPDENEAK